MTDDIEAELIKLRRIELTDKEAAQAGADVLRCTVLQAMADGAQLPRMRRAMRILGESSGSDRFGPLMLVLCNSTAARAVFGLAGSHRVRARQP